MSSTMEVLAPAGGREALEAAVRAGADAVYLGGPQFGARANAQNFSLEELSEAVRYCRQRGVRVHVTVNTLLKDSELPEALEFVRYLCAIPVDAVLVQDMGLFSLLRERAPKLALHASTQMSLHTPSGVRLIKELGARRVVLARELSLEEIREIGDGVDVELESFVHGALCMCVSGQCYLSAMLGGRSGNRGQCAQPCRLPFGAKGGTGHDLSLRDLSFINSIGKLREAGVCSAKIEGRMKRPEYVAAATVACRLAADGKPVPAELSGALEAVFSRSGFTDGYLTGHRGAGMFGTRTKEDVTAATEKVLSGLRELYRSERQAVPVELALTMEEGAAVLRASCGGRCVFVAAKPEPDSPIYNSIPKERCIKQLQKTGGTPFFVQSITVPEEGVPMPVSALNKLRREALDALLEARGNVKPIPFTELPMPSHKAYHRPKGELPVRVVLRDAAQFCPEMAGCEGVCLPIETDAVKLDGLRDMGARLILDLPRAVFGSERELRSLIEERKAMGFTEYLCGNLGTLQLCRELGVTAHGSFSLNIANTPALEFFGRLGLESAELSFELSGREISGLGTGVRRGVMAYGRQALMLTRNCPLANSPRGCLGCKAPGLLTDRKGASFPVICRMRGKFGVEMLNSVPIWLGDLQDELSTDFAVLRFTVENSVESGEILRAFRGRESLNAAYTRGLFKRGVV
ncbi:U32 family peptidase [Acutalibacter sp.]|jgi:putative protease|uniref:U32 family peptidase n=1 Tax=Acutalibacter sp. TaxID=1918636 RepID=UPI0025C508A9|nr:U32 family peptidase [Acutalibacter sp.]